MANLPATTTQNSALEVDSRYQDAVADQITAGLRPDAIAAKIYPNDARKRRSLRRRIWHMVRHDEEFARRVALRARGELLIGLGPAVAGLSRSGARGRVDAAKLLLEASGFHNPRVKHDHSGSIEIKLTMPRPERQAVDIPDADVVD